MKNKVTLPAYVESKTSVWWDINSCPVPVGYDACRVGPCIQSALEKLGCSGPLTISVMGNLKQTPDHVLQALSSSGIVVKHVPCGKYSLISFYSQLAVFFVFFAIEFLSCTESGGRSILTYLLNWTNVNPPPGKIMFISDSLGIEIFSRTLSCLQARGFKILLAYEDTPKQALDLVTSAEWLWKTLLKGVSLLSLTVLQ